MRKPGALSRPSTSLVPPVDCDRRTITAWYRNEFTVEATLADGSNHSLLAA